MDARLLSVVAETGRAAVHEIAGRLGMDVREVAARLAGLSTTGLPLVVGVECDQQAVQNALATANAWNNTPQPGAPHPLPGPPQFQGPPSGGQPVPAPPPSGHGVPSGPHPSQTGPSGPQPFAPSGPQPPPAWITGHPVASPQQGHTAPPTTPGQQDPMSTWGPPGSASWTRGHRPGEADTERHVPRVAPRSGKVGSKLDVDGPEGEQITLQVVEVVDPADFLYTAAGYQLGDGERSVIVHTELTNRGSMPFTSLPDLYLVLVARDGSAVSKAQVSLSSRPPHQIGVSPRATAGGHTVYVLPDSTELSAVRWTPRPGDESRTLTWDISDS